MKETANAAAAVLADFGRGFMGGYLDAWVHRKQVDAAPPEDFVMNAFGSPEVDEAVHKRAAFLGYMAAVLCVVSDPRPNPWAQQRYAWRPDDQAEELH